MEDSQRKDPLNIEILEDAAGIPNDNANNFQEVPLTFEQHELLISNENVQQYSNDNVSEKESLDSTKCEKDETRVTEENVEVPEVGCEVNDDECKSSSDSTNLDTESADEMFSNDGRLSVAYSEPGVTRTKFNGDNISLRSFDSEYSGTSAKFNTKAYAESTGDEEDLLSELESELLSIKPSNESPTKSITGSSKKPTMDTYLIQIDILQQNVSQLQQELATTKASNISQRNEYKKEMEKIKQDNSSTIIKLTKQLDTAKKDKETMIMRYASSEKEVIILRKSKEEIEKKTREIVKDRENLLGKIRQLHADRVRACSSLDTKLAEMAHMQREFEKMRDELNNRDIKIKWAQNKLKSESDCHKDTQLKLEQTVHKLNDTREESEQIRKDCQEMIRRYQEAEEIKSVSLDIQLKEKLSELEVQKQERFDQEEVYTMLRQELDVLKKRQKISVEENNALTVKIQALERERLEYEQNLSKLKDSQNTLRQEVVDLNSKLSEMESLKQQLERERERVTAARNEAERIRQANVELQSDMDACHVKEGELLQFTEKLTSKSVQLQSENSLLELKVQQFEEESSHLSKKVEEMQQSLEKIHEDLQAEKELRMRETQILARKLAEKTKLTESLNIKLGESLNENKVMKRRHLASVKELSRELYHTKKRLDNYEVVSQTGSALGIETVSLGSRTSSSNSLDTMAQCANSSGHIQNGLTHHTSVTSNQRYSPPQDQHSNLSNQSSSIAKSNSSSCPNCTTNSSNSNFSNSQGGVEIDRQVLIERIFKLQNQLARKNEKNEFLEEHNNQLLAELKKKSKIIQKYVLETEAGALVPNTMDMNKAELARKGGGVMASVYSNQVTDNNLTLKLSLEINQKLQAVLEDTLLKNITLKENINTLGEEIARITKEQRDLQPAALKSFK